MRVMITGGAGFIGSHLADDLLGAGHEVAIVDSLATGRLENVPRGARFDQIDICDAGAVDRVLADFRPEVISHHAAQTSVSVSTREPIRDAEVNILGSLNVLGAAQRVGTRRIVFASTGGAIYGEVAEGTAAPVTAPTGPLSPYACSKLAFEGYLHAAFANKAIDVRILRYANVYGPRQDPHGEAGVVAIFAERLLRGAPICVFAMAEEGDPGCVRDYIYVGDVVQAHRRAVEDRKLPRTVNVSTGVPTTTLEIAETLHSLAASESKIAFGPIRDGDLQRSVLEPSKELQLQPQSLSEGLTTTFEWFKQRPTQ